jgi:putative transposase
MTQRQRHSLRLRGYDYATPGAYFVTVCVGDRLPMLDKLAKGEIVTSKAGGIVGACWQALPDHYHNVELDGFVVMPNHVHGTLVVSGTDPVGAGLKPALLLR